MDRYQQHVQYHQDPQPIPAGKVSPGSWESFTFAQIEQELIRNELAQGCTEYLDPTLRLPWSVLMATPDPFRFQRETPTQIIRELTEGQ